MREAPLPPAALVEQGEREAVAATGAALVQALDDDADVLGRVHLLLLAAVVRVVDDLLVGGLEAEALTLGRVVVVQVVAVVAVVGAEDRVDDVVRPGAVAVAITESYECSGTVIIVYLKVN